MTAHKARGVSRIGLSVAFGLAFLLCGCDKPSPAASEAKKASDDAGEAIERLNREHAIHVANENADKGKAPKPTLKSTPSELASKWSYSEDVDKMRGTKTTLANVDSENKVAFIGLPFKGGTATLTLRKRPSDGLSVLLLVEGQFMCSSYSYDEVAVKFDSGPVENYRCDEPANGTTGLLFIQNAKRFVAKLKKAHSVTIEAQFYQAGARQMEFDVAGLEWK